MQSTKSPIRLDVWCAVVLWRNSCSSVGTLDRRQETWRSLKTVYLLLEYLKIDILWTVFGIQYPTSKYFNIRMINIQVRNNGAYSETHRGPNKTLALFGVCTWVGRCLLFSIGSVPLGIFHKMLWLCLLCCWAAKLLGSLTAPLLCQLLVDQPG